MFRVPLQFIARWISIIEQIQFMFDTLSNLFELLQIYSRYGLFVLALIDSMLVFIAAKKGIKQEITIFRGFLEFHHKYGLWKTTCTKIIVSLLLGYPIVLFARPALFLLYSIHVIIFEYRLFFKTYNSGSLQDGN